MIDFKTVDNAYAAPTLHGKWLPGTKPSVLMHDGRSIGFIHPPTSEKTPAGWRVILSLRDYTHFTWVTLKPDFETLGQAKDWVIEAESFLLTVLPVVHRMRDV